MKRMIKAIALIFVLAALVCMSFGCSYTEPSSKEAAEKHLKHDFDDLTYMVQWLQDMEQPYVAFCRTWDHALIGLDKVPIDEEIAPVVKRLLKEYELIVMDAETNRIQFEFWTSVHDQGCGLLYALEQTKQPTVEYMTQREPLSVEGWYYYFTDFNEWRVEQTRDKE